MTVKNYPTPVEVFPILKSVIFWLAIGLILVGIATGIVMFIFAEGEGLLVGLITAGMFLSIGVISLILWVRRMLKRRAEVLRIDLLASSDNLRYVVYRAESDLYRPKVEQFMDRLPYDYIDILGIDLVMYTPITIEISTSKLPKYAHVTFKKFGTIFNQGELMSGLQSGKYADISFFSNESTVRSLIRHEMGHMLLDYNGFEGDHHALISIIDNMRHEWIKEENND